LPNSLFAQAIIFLFLLNSWAIANLWKNENKLFCEPHIFLKGNCHSIFFHVEFAIQELFKHSTPTLPRKQLCCISPILLMLWFQCTIHTKNFDFLA